MTAISSLHPLMSMPAAAPRGAEVLGREGDVLLVACGAERVQATAALSCLVAPEPGDLVLLGEACGRHFVLAVLERRQAQPLRLLVEGDLEVAASGRLRLHGEAEVAIASSATISATAPEAAMTARRARFSFGEVSAIARALTAQLGRAKLVGEALETVMERVLARVKRSYRFVEEGDHLRAGAIDHRAERSLHLRGENAVIHGGKVVKVDGGQIQLG
jgi:hypothetical protein